MVSHTDKETGLTIRIFEKIEWLELIYKNNVIFITPCPRAKNSYGEDWCWETCGTEWDLGELNFFQEILEGVLENRGHKKLLLRSLGNAITDEDHIKKIREIIYGPFDGNSTVCSDCALYLVNNDLPEDDEQGERIIAGSRQGLWTVDIDNPEEFSRIRCDCCGTSLGGGRYPARLEVLEG